MKNLRNDNIFKLSDGRRLGYAQYGNLEGYPIFLFHGNPGSRLSWGLIPGSPFLSGIHIIAPELKTSHMSEVPKVGFYIAYHQITLTLLISGLALIIISLFNSITGIDNLALFISIIIIGNLLVFIIVSIVKYRKLLGQSIPQIFFFTLMIVLIILGIIF